VSETLRQAQGERIREGEQMQEFDLIYEDNALLVFNKPSGLLSVPGKGPEKADCLRTRVQQVYPEALTVHRLDMSTSGILLMARSAALHRALSIAFQDREVHKRYIALVYGQIQDNHCDDGDDSSTWRLIDLPIATDWINRPLQKIDATEGKPSQTRYKIMSYDAQLNATQVELAPITGRTHQLRVHLQALGHPILGDHLYASPEIQAKSHRLMLHASSLAIKHPQTGEKMQWHSPAPF
jgi:tRNA pseudouridine32 synthase / 23S rRNA pseudouridine746 synthase